RVAVEPRQLALGIEAGEAVVGAQEPAPGAADGLLGAVPRPVADHERGALRAEAREALGRLARRGRGHDWLVVTADAPDEDEPDESFELLEPESPDDDPLEPVSVDEEPLEPVSVELEPLEPEELAVEDPLVVA